MANPQATFPTVPQSLYAGDHGTHEYSATEDRQRHTVPEITPYLGLRARLSQIWINRWTVLLFLILVRVLIAIAGLNNDLGSAKKEALSACNAVEQAGSAMASMPHFMSKGVNELAATGVEKAVNGLMSMLLLTITGVEELVVFYINLLTSTYVCLITLVISGALHVALQVVEDASKFLNKTLGDIGTDIHKGIDGFQDDLNKFTGALNSIPQIFGKKGSIPKLNIDSQLDALDHVQLPADLDEKLGELNKSIPDFAQVNNFTNNVIRFPFEEVKKLVNNSLHTFEFNRSLLPVPQKEQLSFCSDNDDISKFFQHLAHIAEIARRVFVGVLVVLAILACIPMAWKEIRRWRTMQQRAQLVGDKSYDPLDVIYIASRPYTAAAGIKAATPFRGRKRQLLTRWAIAYGTSTPALLVLSLGVTGLLACLCQLILLKALEKEVPALAGEVGDFAGKVINTVNNASEHWALGTNHAITKTNNGINNDLFGWVNTSTSALNGTLNTFVNEMTKALNKTFGGTVLQDPVNEVFNCLIGLKVAGIEKGLTWVHDHAHVDFPLLNNDTFSLDHIASVASDGKTDSFLSDPSGGATDKVTAAIKVVAEHLEDAIRTEALISTALVCIYLLIVILGLSRAIWLSAKASKVRGEGGPSTAGDIPMTDQPPQQVTRAGIPDDAAPAYEPPRHTQFHLPRFGGAFHRGTGTQRSGGSESEGSEEEEEWRDEKVGMAGDRGPAALHVTEQGNGRRSEHGLFEKS